MTARRRDDRRDDLQRVGRPRSWKRSRFHGTSTVIARCSPRHASNSLAPRRIARVEAAGLTHWAAPCAALTAASPSQKRGRERPHPRLAVVAPQLCRGVAHALVVTVSLCGGGGGVLTCGIASTILVSMCGAMVAESFGQTRPRFAAQTVLEVVVTSVRPVHGIGSSFSRRSPGRPSRLSILERHARASSLGAPRRPVRAAGLTRARLALAGQLRDGRHLHGPADKRRNRH